MCSMLGIAYPDSMHTKLSLRKSAGLLSIAAVAILGFAGQSNADSKDAEQTKEDVINAPIDPTEITAKGHRWVRAADGRIIEYSVTGSTRPDARTLVTMYFATSKVRPDLMKTYEDLNIRLINVSLPGL